MPAPRLCTRLPGGELSTAAASVHSTRPRESAHRQRHRGEDHPRCCCGPVQTLQRARSNTNWILARRVEDYTQGRVIVLPVAVGCLPRAGVCGPRRARPRRRAHRCPPPPANKVFSLAGAPWPLNGGGGRLGPKPSPRGPRGPRPLHTNGRAFCRVDVNTVLVAGGWRPDPGTTHWGRGEVWGAAFAWRSGRVVWAWCLPARSCDGWGGLGASSPRGPGCRG